MGRQPMHWPYPDQLQPGEVCLSLGRLEKKSHTVAPFWVQAPGGRGLISMLAGQLVSQHLPSQTGETVHLVDPAIDQPVNVQFTAELITNTASGETIRRQIIVPVEILPA